MTTSVNFQGISRVSLVPSLHDSAVSSTHVLCILEVFRDRAVMAAVNSTHQVPDPGTTKKSNEKDKFRCKDTVISEGTQREVL